MRLKYLPLIILLAIPLSLSGCWSKGEINSLGIIRGLGIDQSPNGYVVTVQVITPNLIGRGQSRELATVTLFSVTEQTIFKALRRISTTSTRRLYIGHLGLIIIGEAQARAGIGRLLDFLMRDHETRINFRWIVAQGTTAQNILSILTPIESVPTQNIINTLEISEQVFGTTKLVESYQLINQITNPYSNPVLPGVSATGDPERQYNIQSLKSTHLESRLYVKELAAFKADRLVGWLNETESKGYNYLVDNIKNPVETMYIKKEKTKIAIEVTESKCKLQGRIRAGRPEIIVNLNIAGKVGEIEGNYDLGILHNLVRLEKALKVEVTREMQAAVKRGLGELKVDIFGFGEAIHRSDPKAWRKQKSHWENKLPQITIKYQVQTKLISTGLISKPYWREPEEE